MHSFKQFFESRLIVYHGTGGPIAGFDSKKQLSGYYPGFYTTIDREATSSYGTHVHEFDVTGLRFYPVDSKASEELKKAAREAGFWVTSGSGRGEVDYLKSLGYDGIQRGHEYIIFNPEKVLKL